MDKIEMVCRKGETAVQVIDLFGTSQRMSFRRLHIWTELLFKIDRSHRGPEAQSHESKAVSSLFMM